MSTQEAQAQDYKLAAGLRLGSPWALSAKAFLSESSAFEAYVGYRGFLFYNSISINGAYLIHQDLAFEGIEGLRWYFGGGGGVQFWSFDAFNEGSTYFNVTGYLGLEFTLPDTPISITADWTPTVIFGDGFNGIGDTGFRGGYGGLGVRYILSR